MPTKIFDLELTQLPEELDGLENYQRALILFRYHGRPVSQTYLPIEGKGYNRDALRKAFQATDCQTLKEHLLTQYLLGLEAPQARPGQDLLSKTTATIAICTHNRVDDLRNCLESLLALPEDGQEILVIDNCPRDDATRALVASYTNRVRYVREPRKGLDIARNRAMQEAKGEIVAFIDDDAVAEKNWLSALLANFDDPAVLCVTGLTMPLELETEAQEWFEKFYPFGRGFSKIVFDRNLINPAAAGKCGAGVNMALRRSILQTVGTFEERLDSGTATRSGGDTEMYTRIVGAGYKIVYDPAAVNWHRHRRTWRELELAAFGYGTGIYATWTHALWKNGELSVLFPALIWLLYPRLPKILGSLWRRQHKTLFRLLLAETFGCIYGPFAYWRAVRSQNL